MNAVVFVVILFTVIPVTVAQRLTREQGVLRRGGAVAVEPVAEI